ncbi:MAG: hypothetical protein IPO37_12510 [Saprospiraceae bacterium]|nr:hypothetical protein [Saprospiraceae bacterium]
MQIERLNDFNMITNILVGIIILHLIAGFGFILWKLNGPAKDDDDDDESDL